MTEHEAIEGARLGTALLQARDNNEMIALTDHATIDELRVAAHMLAHAVQHITALAGADIRPIAATLAHNDKETR